MERARSFEQEGSRTVYFDFRTVLTALFCFLVAGNLAAQPLRIYIDADYSMSKPSADAIELGIRTALNEVDNLAGGQKIEVVPRDHRGNSKRSKAILSEFVEDPYGLAVFGGVHSPPYLRYRKYINQSEILLLLPWSAAGPITRAEAGVQNWIFRLSVDDTKAGPYLAERALIHNKCQKTALMLLDSGWGRANRVAILKAFRAAQAAVPSVYMFPSTVGPDAAQALAKSVADVGTDCVILLANAKEGALLVNSLHTVQSSLKVISHWGILADDFAKTVPGHVRSDLAIEVLQTCGLKIEKAGEPVLSMALASADAGTGRFARLSDVPASAGFVHGYDLTKLLLAAIEVVAFTDAWQDGSIEDRRRSVRDTLENLPHPIDGILKTYYRPFGEYSQSAPDTHEALGLRDLCVATFDQEGNLVLADMTPDVR